MSEYVTIYHKVKELLKYFGESSIPEKEIYKSSLVNKHKKIKTNIKKNIKNKNKFNNLILLIETMPTESLRRVHRFLLHDHQKIRLNRRHFRQRKRKNESIKQNPFFSRMPSRPRC